MPLKEGLDHLLRQYFRYVHPILPLIDEVEFWHAYAHTRACIPIILLQAMLFVSCAVS